MTVAVVTLGFDVTHAVFTITRYKPLRVIVLLARVRGRIDPRTSVAYSSLEQLVGAMGAVIERVEVEVSNPVIAVEQIRRVLEKVARTSPLVLDLGGGLRLLVLEAFIAYYSLPSELKENSRVVIYLEATNESVEIASYELKKMMLKKPATVSSREELVLSAMEPLREYTLDQIYREVSARGFKTTKQNLVKVLKKLESNGLLVKTGRGKYMKT